MLKVHISVGGSEFSLEGEFQPVDVLELIKVWYSILTSSEKLSQEQIDKAVARLAAQNTELKAGVDASGRF